MPPSAQREKPALLARIQAAQATDPTGPELAGAIRDFETVYPGDPALLLISIGAEIVRGDVAAVAKRDLKTGETLDKK